MPPFSYSGVPSRLLSSLLLPPQPLPPAAQAEKQKQREEDEGLLSRLDQDFKALAQSAPFQALAAHKHLRKPAGPAAGVPGAPAAVLGKAPKAAAVTPLEVRTLGHKTCLGVLRMYSAVQYTAV